jgi:hypothetical protein
LYFLIKPDPNIKTADGFDQEGTGSSSGYMMLGAYFLVVVISQFFVNAYLITQSCGGDIIGNLGQSAKETLLAWLLIFGVTIVTVVAYPDIKSAFADVYGYYFVYGPAQTILTEILKGKIDTSIPTNTDAGVGANIDANTAAPAAGANIDANTASGAASNAGASGAAAPSNAGAPVNAADISGTVSDNKKGGGKKIIQKGGALSNDEISDLVLKIYGNMSILINQLTPSNFNYYWENMLTPLFKNKYKPEEITAVSKENLEKNKKDLLTLVIKRDNIGEGMWYIYTGVLICSLVQFKLSSIGCKSNQEILATNYKKVREEQKISNATATNNATNNATSNAITTANK